MGAMTIHEAGNKTHFVAAQAETHWRQAFVWVSGDHGLAVLAKFLPISGIGWQI
jgi:hypothetical protein